MDALMYGNERIEPQCTKPCGVCVCVFKSAQTVHENKLSRVLMDTIQPDAPPDDVLEQALQRGIADMCRISSHVALAFTAPPQLYAQNVTTYLRLSHIYCTGCYVNQRTSSKLWPTFLAVSAE
eukprot:2247165-Amphidinium_carterae.1